MRIKLIICIAIAVLGIFLLLGLFIKPYPSLIQETPVTLPFLNATATPAPQNAAEVFARRPSNAATTEEKSLFFELVRRFAVRGTELDITSCKPNPIILAVPYKEVLVVHNRDNKLHPIFIDMNHEYIIPANATRSIRVEFGKKGAIGYGCDDSTSSVGYFIVEG